jgi:hypothetical protein
VVENQRQQINSLLCRLSKTAICSSDSNDALQSDAVEVTMGSLWGIFWIVYGSIGLSFLILIAEWLVSTFRSRKSPTTVSKRSKLCKEQ